MLSLLNFIKETALNPKDPHGDYQAKRKALQDIQMDPHTHKDPQLSSELAYRKAALEKEYDKYRAKEEVNLEEQAPVAPSIGVHRIGVTVSEPDHPSVSKRKETQQKFVRVTAHDKDKAIEQGKKHFAKKGFKVHDAEHVGMIHEEVEQIHEITHEVGISYDKNAMRAQGKVRVAAKDHDEARTKALDSMKGREKNVKAHSSRNLAKGKETDTAKFNEEVLDEKAPPGFEGTVKAMKKHKEIDNPYALAWYLKNKGAKSHRNPDGTVKEESEQIDEAVNPSEIAGNPKMYSADTVKKAYYHKNASDSDKQSLARHLDRHHGNKEWRKPVKEDVEQIDERSDEARRKKTLKNVMDAARGARYNLQSGLNIKPGDTGHSTTQQMNKALGRHLRREEVEQLDEYGNTARGQKMLAKVQKRATDRLIKADDKNRLEPDVSKRDLNTVRKNAATAQRAYDRMEEEVEQLDEKTPSRQEVKQAIGIARDKRYAGGNMTGATKAMDKVNKGLAQHPAVAKELQKQNEEVQQIDELAPETLSRYIGKRQSSPTRTKAAVDAISQKFSGHKGPTKLDYINHGLKRARQKYDAAREKQTAMNPKKPHTPPPPKTGFRSGAIDDTYGT